MPEAITAAASAAASAADPRRGERGRRHVATLMGRADVPSFGPMVRWLPASDAAPIPLGRTNLVFEEQRRFVRKSVTLALAILLMAPLIYYKDTHELTVLLTRIYLVALVVIHVFALVVFIHRVPWRALFRHPVGLLTRGGGLVIFGGLLAMLEFDSGSPWFWGALTLLWLFHVGALALLHIRHRREPTQVRARGCPVGPFSPRTPGDSAEDGPQERLP